VKPSHSNGDKTQKKSGGHNPLSDASYWNLGMVLNGQGLDQHSIGDMSFRDN
jgi:hypothetical protein